MSVTKPTNSGVLRTLEQQSDPGLSALVIVDMINDLCHPDGIAAKNRDLLPVKAIIPRIQALVTSAKRAAIPVIYVLHTTLPGRVSNSGPWTAAREMALRSAPDLGLDGSWGQAVIDELKPAPGDPLIKKFRYSAFRSTPLDRLLRSRGRQSAVFTGVSTNVCVMASAHDALELDYYSIIVEDAMASWDMDLHFAALKMFRARYGLTCQTAELVRLWDAAGNAEKAST